MTFPESDVTDPDLIELARRGDDRAWATLVRQHQEAIFRLAYLLLGEAGPAQDVAQDTFIRAFQALDRFDAGRSLRPWLLQIAANLARNRRRSRGRYWAALQRWWQARSEPDPVGANPDVEQERLWEAHRLWQAIRRLNHIDQEVIYLRYFLELSVVETAEAINVAPGTVKSRLHRALGRLRQVIEREFPALQEERLQ
jgi:RNA polymerase sigma-70 factor (ECF subfamily)